VAEAGAGTGGAARGPGDAGTPGEAGGVGAATAGARRARSIDATLAAAGIGREHPSLYPGKKP
jgi:hypothetical protein